MDIDTYRLIYKYKFQKRANCMSFVSLEDLVKIKIDMLHRLQYATL